MDRWTIQAPGRIRWDAAADRRLPHQDHIELSGRRCSMVVRYGADGDGRLLLEQTLVFPGLRTIPNDTHASLLWPCPAGRMACVRVDGAGTEAEYLDRVDFDGVLTLTTHIGGVRITRQLLPSRRGQYALQRLTLRNDSGGCRDVEFLPAPPPVYARGCRGVYILEQRTEGQSRRLAPGETVSAAVCYTGRTAHEDCPTLPASEEWELRRSFTADLTERLVLETPDEVINNAFALAKLRAAESVFQTRGGLMHCPGGLRYYAAVWTNDQVEYAGPFFPYLGENAAVEASKTAYELYLPFMAEDYRAIPSSIIAEGGDIWEGAGDRGDAAMYACGAAGFVLALGDRAYAEKLWPAIQWCLEYCRRRTTAEGVVASDTDELEGRFPAGEANLCTSCLYYGGLKSAAILAGELGENRLAEVYTARAAALAAAIEGYFGAEVEGFRTYRYYAENTTLRSWLCLPLVFDLTERREETVRALFSDKLWTPDGLATESGDTVFWDRSTLYALRGVFRAGAADRALPYLLSYSRRWTLGDHVPYPVEAWPEGSQRHLSAESALYCRIFTEGVFGITPAGLSRFTLRLRLPGAWDRAALRHVCAFGADFDLSVVREGNGLTVTVSSEGVPRTYHAAEGQALLIDLSTESRGN